jgi:predicted TIM-barrel fold metal-dependent hydrolase
VGRSDARIHPLAPFNPLREVRELKLEGSAAVSRYLCDAAPLTQMPKLGALARLRYAIENLGFVGAKVYPPSGFRPIDNDSWAHHHEDTKLGGPLDQALHAFYAYCEAEEVPVLTHANNSNGFALGYGILTDPDDWERVLTLYPRLRLNLGHFGELEGDDPDRGIAACELWMRKIAALMTRFPNVYADCGCSAVPVEKKKQERYLSLLADLYAAYPRVSKRFMFGTDFWLNRFWRNSETFVDAFAALYKQRFPGYSADFFGNNALRFYGLLDDSGAKPSTRNRTRLRAWYRALGVNEPTWLT